MSYTPSAPLPLSATKKYAWHVQTIESSSGNVIASSNIREFTISQLQLIYPAANQYLNMKKPKFMWIYQGETEKYYDLKVVQLPMILTPSFNINNLFSNGPFLYRNSTISGKDNSITNSNNLEIVSFTPPSDLSLNTGINYAWRVEEKDSPFGNVILTSEIRNFKFDPYQAGFATNCQVTGNLFYEFADPGEYVIWPLKNISVKLVTKYMLKYDSYENLGGYSYQDINGINQTSSTGEIELNTYDLPYEFRQDNQKTVAIGKSNDNGFISFSFMNIKPMGVVKDNFVLNGGSNEFKYSYHGKLYRVLRLIVQSPYYTSPNTDIILQPGETKNYGQLIANARSYQLTVNVKTPGSYWNNQYLSGNTNLNKMIVYLLRKTRPSEVPENDGFPRAQNPNDKPLHNFEVVGRTISDQYGNAVFRRLIKNVYSQNDEYWIWATVDSNQTSLIYRMWLPMKYSFKYSNDKAVYNNDYKYVGVSKNVVAFPLNPIVRGKIKRQDGGQPIANAKVKLLDYAVFWWQEEANTLTNGSGKFWFNNLKNVYDDNGNPTGPVRGLKISKYGFRDTSLAVKSGAILKPGESWNREVLLQPDSKIKGKIVDEYGNGISADVTVEGGETVKAIAPFILSMPGFKILPASFEIRAPKGIVHIKFDPKQYNSSYLMKDTTIYVSGNIKDLGTIVIRKALHRIKIFAGDASKAGGEFYFVTSKLPGAKVRLETSDGKLIGQKLTNQFGFAEFVFANAAKIFKVTVSAPKNQDFETGQMYRYNEESEYMKTYPIFLKPASHISGYVYVGTQNLPVANAHIWLDYSSSGLNTETYTDSSGYYKLSNVPIGSSIAKASKKSSNLIGDQKNITVPQGGLQNINFNLKVYSAMDITHLLGFPIEVDSLTEQNGEVKISGKFVDLDQLNNNYFKSNSSSLKFTQVVIEPHPTLTSVIFGKTVPVAKPKLLPLKTDNNSLSLNIYDKYSGFIN